MTFLSTERGRVSQAEKQQRQRPQGGRERVAYLGNLPWFSMTGMEKVAEDKVTVKSSAVPNLCNGYP